MRRIRSDGGIAEGPPWGAELTPHGLKGFGGSGGGEGDVGLVIGGEGEEEEWWRWLIAFVEGDKGDLANDWRSEKPLLTKWETVANVDRLHV
jgi:hypothetical protein